MAKQSVNIVERHVEKVVLALCAAVLAASVVRYLVSTPNTVDLDGELVHPSTIYERIRDVGRAIKDQYARAEPDKVEVVDHVPALQNASSPLAYAGLTPTFTSPVPFLPPVPDIGDAPPRVGEIRLATVVAPSKPLATTGRSTVNLVPPVPLAEGGKAAEENADGPAFETDVNWVTVGALFDQQQQISTCKKAGYKAGRRNPYVVGVDLQRRERRLDGTYSDWTAVKAYAPAVLPPLPVVKIVQGRKALIATESTREGISAFFNLLRDTQADLFRPMFPAIKYGAEWLYPKFKDIDIPTLDRDLCRAGEDCTPRDYPPQSDLVPVAPVAKTDVDKVEDALTLARELLEKHRWDEVIRRAKDIKEMPPKRVNQIRKADQLIADAKQGKLDDERNPPKKPRDDTEDTVQRRSRYQVVWAHDAEAAAGGGAVSGKTYQYRMRVKLYNRYCAVPADVADRADAERVFVVGEWSPPTDDVVIPPDTQFFLTSGSTNTRSRAKVTVFKWFEGVWVSHGFALKTGEPIGGGAKKPVRVLPNGDLDRPLVDFYTGSTVVDIDYEYEYRARRRKGRTGFIVDSPKMTVALVYLDQEGTLRQRILAADRLSRPYKHFKEIVFQPPARR